MQREKLGSRLGFILLSAGCAIGIGNVWKFPYMAGQYGGGIFVLIYLLFLVIMGVPVMTMEFAIGRASQKSPVKMHEALEPKKKGWSLHGWAALLGCYLLMMFYTTVTGWMIQYFVNIAGGKLVGMDTAGIESFFGGMKAEPVAMIVYMGFVVVAGFLVCSFGLKNGLERITKYMMLALLAIMVILAVNSIFLENGSEGLKFYLVPDINRMKSIGIGNVIVGAMTQAFFTLSLGIGSMAIFGSYLDKKRALMGEAINVAILDTFVAFVSGLIIFPACFANKIDVNAGPDLIFLTLPQVFNDMPMGRLWGSLFFVFLSFAAISTVLAVFESIIACTMDLFKWSRKKACLINCIGVFILSVPCVLGFNVWSAFRPFGEGTGVMELEDFIVSNVLLPLGSLAFVIFCMTRYGWGWNKFKEEANTGKGVKVADWMRGYMTFVLPVIIVILFVVGIYNFFK